MGNGESFMIQCEEAIPEEVINSEDFDLENYKKDDEEFFNYIYDNLKYPQITIIKNKKSKNNALQQALSNRIDLPSNRKK